MGCTKKAPDDRNLGVKPSFQNFKTDPRVAFEIPWIQTLLLNWKLHYEPIGTIKTTIWGHFDYILIKVNSYILIFHLMTQNTSECLKTRPKVQQTQNHLLDVIKLWNSIPSLSSSNADFSQSFPLSNLLKWKTYIKLIQPPWEPFHPPPRTTNTIM